jgi:hypothetical protein
MSYRCPQCGLPRTGNQAVGLAMPQCLCSWQFSPSAPAPQRTWEKPWVSLTDEEVEKMRHLIDWTAHWSYGTFARAIEAKLKEKNNA